MSVDIAICVPVRDEEAVLPGLLAGLGRLRINYAIGEVSCCFLLDGCTDRSERILGEERKAMPFDMSVIACPLDRGGNVGRARHEAMLLGLDRIGARASSRLLSTDADSVPDPDWLIAAVAALQAAEVAAGRIVRDHPAADPLQGQVEDYYDRLHTVRRSIDPVAWQPDGGHHFGGGANLGFRADSYVALGGFPPLATGEDAVLLDQASRAGMRVRRDGDMIVTTSARRAGRVVGGLAGALRRLDRDREARVPHPAGSIWQYRAHAAARDAFARIDDAGVRAAFGRSIGLSGDHALGVARDCPNAEAFAMRIVPIAPIPPREVSVAEAQAVLDALFPAPVECAA